MLANLRWTLILTLAAGVPVLAQTGKASSASSNRSAPCNCASRPPEPYSATFKTTVVQPLADGTTITRVLHDAQARDSAGRWMNSHTMDSISDSQNAITFTTVHDPVANTDISWNSQSHEARITHKPPADERHGCWADSAGSVRMEFPPLSAPVAKQTTAAGTPAGVGVGAGGGGGAALPSQSTGLPQIPPPEGENLGTSTIMGVEVRGTRTTTITPAGAIGNDRPLVQSSEMWIAPSLGFALRSVVDNPRTGKTTREVQSLDLGEPPISLFQPPQGYKVTDEQLHPVDCPPRR